MLFCVLPWAAVARAQGVTTGGVSGVVKDSQGGVLPGVTVTAVHVPSDTTYSAVTQADGHFYIPGMRVGGPYTVSAVLQGFQTEEKHDVVLSLGVTQDLTFALGPAKVAETIVVTAESSPIFSSAAPARPPASRATNWRRCRRCPAASTTSPG